MIKATWARLLAVPMIFSVMLVSGWVCLAIQQGPNGSPVLWLPSGFSILLLLLLGLRYWPLLAVYWWGTYFYSVIPSYLEHFTLLQRLYLSLFLALASSLQMYLLVYTLNRLGGRSLLKSSANTGKFFLIVLAVGCLKALILICSGILLVGTTSPDWKYFLPWWFLGINSVFLIVPTGLVLSNGLKNYRKLLCREYVLITSLLIFFSACMLSPAFKPYVHYSTAYIFIPFLLWSTFRFGHEGFSIIALFLLIFQLTSLSYQTGPFAEASPFVTFYVTQIFLGVYTSTGYFFASVLEERQRFENELKNAAAELVPDIVSHIDSEGRFLSLNPAFEKLLGWKRSEWIGKSCFQIVHEEDRKNLINASVDLISKKSSTLQLRLRMRTQKGDYVEVEVRGSPHYKGDKITSFFGVSRDITEKRIAEKKLKHYTKELEIAHRELAYSHADLEKRILDHTRQIVETNQALLASNNQLQQYAYVASHDLQEPARMISLYLQLIQNQCSNKMDAETMKYINYTLTSAKRMRELIRDILVYSRLDAHIGTKTNMDSAVAIEEARENLKSLFESTKATLHFENMPRIYCEKTPLSQVFQNLFENSIKFRSNSSPIITVRALEQEKVWVFSVADNGVGIEPQFQSKVFDMFYRLHSREHSPGTGIGLAVCKKIIHILGGNIWVESDGSSGSTFFFTLPKSVNHYIRHETYLSLKDAIN